MFLILLERRIDYFAFIISRSEFCSMVASRQVFCASVRSCIQWRLVRAILPRRYSVQAVSSERVNTGTMNFEIKFEAKTTTSIKSIIARKQLEIEKKWMRAILKKIQFSTKKFPIALFSHKGFGFESSSKAATFSSVLFRTFSWPNYSS